MNCAKSSCEVAVLSCSTIVAVMLSFDVVLDAAPSTTGLAILSTAPFTMSSIPVVISDTIPLTFESDPCGAQCDSVSTHKITQNMFELRRIVSEMVRKNQTVCFF